MDIKKPVFLLLFLFVAAALAFGNWQDALQDMLADKEFGPARELCHRLFRELDELYHPLLCQVSAFCCWGLNDRPGELRWIAASFEAFPWGEAVTSSLRDSLHPGLTPYIQDWKEKYPYVRDLSFTQRERPAEEVLPQKLVMEITLGSRAYFKLFKEEQVVSAGEFRKGQNLISLKTGPLFRGSDRHTFILELMSGGVIVQKSVVIQVEIESLDSGPKPEIESIEKDYTLSLYYQDQLLASGKKTESLPLTDKLELPPSAYEPSRYDPLGRTDPLANSFSILSAIGIAAQLIKGLVQKEDRDKPRNPLQKVKSMTIPFRTTTLTGEKKRSQAVVVLKTDHISPRLASLVVREE